MKMITTSNTEQSLRVMRNAAIHECGHVLVCSHYGIWATPSIWRSHTNNLDLEKIWIGNTRYNVSSTSSLRNRRIAIAGLIAEEIDSVGAPIECFEFNLAVNLEVSYGANYEDSDGWSRTDWEGAQGWTAYDVHSVYMILMHNWKTLLAEVEALVKDAVEHDILYTDIS